MRRAPRSSALRAMTSFRPGWLVSTWGTWRRHWASRSVGVARSTGCPHRYLGVHSRALEHRTHLDAGGPLGTGRDDHLERGQVRGQQRGVVKPDLHTSDDSTPTVRRDHRGRTQHVRRCRGTAGTGCVGRLRGVSGAGHVHRGGQLAGTRLGTHSSLLDGEEVGEVRPDEDLHGADGGLVGEVPDGQVLAHPLAHVPGAEDHQRGVGPSGSGHAARDEGGGERVVGHRGQGLGSDPVDQHLEPAEDPGVPDEQALGRPLASCPRPPR